MDEKYFYEMFTVKNRVAVVTGGGGVLCGEMSRALAQAGAKVAVLDISLEAAEQVVDQIRKSGGDAIALQCDVLDHQSIEAAAAQVQAHYPRVDILINGAGGNKKEATTTPDYSFFDIPADAIRWVFDLNLVGALLPSQVFGRTMVQQKEGLILNISSMNAYRPLTRIPAYSAAKAAVANFTQWLAVHMALEYSPNIRVNALAPGFFVGKQNRHFLLNKDDSLTPRGKQILNHTPMGRFGNPEDLLGTVFWLLSPASSFITGIVVPVDGGFSAYSGV